MWEGAPPGTGVCHRYVKAGLPLPTVMECRESVAGAWLQHVGGWIRLVAMGVGCEWGMLMETLHSEHNMSC